MGQQQTAHKWANDSSDWHHVNPAGAATALGKFRVSSQCLHGNGNQ
jgi:hypothetical protein